MATRLSIARLIEVDSGHVDPEIARRYADQIDDLPPIVVFLTPEGLLVADGYHRLAAAKLLGRDWIEADVREGSRSDALSHAATANERDGRPVGREEALRAIERRRR